MRMNYTKSDLMAVTIARYLKSVKSCFHGLASPLPMVSIMLARKLYNSELIYLNITGGINICNVPLCISTDSSNLYNSSRSVFNLTDIFDLAARGGLEVAFLSGGQVDALGQVNNSCIGPFVRPKVKLPGGAGSAVLIPNARRAFIWKSRHEKRGFIKKVDFVTSYGNVDYVFTPLCVFKKTKGRLMLVNIMPDTTIQEIIENTGFKVTINAATVINEPTQAEMQALLEIDPSRIRDSEF